MELKIKAEHKDRVVAHHDTGLPLGQQSQPQLQQLALMARQSGSPLFLDFFEELPTLAELLGEKTESEIATAKSNPALKEIKTTDKK